nr:retrovirus-related Pol polyprotein from transposon TNT 1-94 [Tanacetum cinerariifolium]
MTLIKVARTMLAYSLLPIPFWAEAVNTACYVQNRVLVIKPHNKTPYELLLGRTPSIGFMRPFGCYVIVLNTLDPLGKFNGKADEGFLVGYSNTNGDAAFEVKEPEFERKKPESEVRVSPSSSAHTKKHDDKTKREAKGKSHVELSTRYRNLSVEFKDFFDNSINEVNAADTLVPAVGQISTNITNTFSAAGPSNTVVSPTYEKSSYMDPSQYPDDPNMPALEDITYSNDDEDVGANADFTNLETNVIVSPIPTTRVHKDHHEEGIDYEEVFAPVARIEDIMLFPAYSFFMGFMVYQMNIKSAYLYGTIKEEVYVCQPLGFEDPDYPDKQIVVSTSSTKAEYVAAASCCAQVLWIQNQLLDYGLTMQVAQSSMKSLKRNLHVTNILSVGYITTPQMVLNSPCLTHIKND